MVVYPNIEVRYQQEDTSEFQTWKKSEKKGEKGSGHVGTLVQPLWRAAGSRFKSPTLAAGRRLCN